MRKIVITLTTIPERLISQYGYDMKYCIESLLSQNYDEYYEEYYGEYGEYDAEAIEA